MDAAELIEVRRALQAHPLFAGLGPRARATLARSAAMLAAPPGARLVSAGDPADAAFLLLAGEVEVLQEGAGGEVLVARLESGDWFGEMALLDGGPRSATVRAGPGGARLVRLERPHFLAALRRSPDAFAHLFGELSRRARDTTRRSTEQELARRGAELRRREELHAALTELVAGLAHELNGPISVARLAGELAAQGQAEEAAPLLDGALREVAGVVELIRELGERGRGTPVDLDLRELVEDTVALEQAGAPGLEVALAPGPPLPWRGHADALAAVLRELLANTRHHAGGRGVRVTLARDAAGLELAVADAGPGVPEADRERIFRPFVTTARGRGRRGLGLALVRQWVDTRLGGAVAVETSPEGGALFRVRLP